MNWKKLQSIDRRILYILMAIVIICPLIAKPSRHSNIVFNEVKNAYNVIDAVPDDKIVIVSDIWGPGTIAENGPQTEIILRHMFMKNKKFIMISWDQAGTELTYKIGKELEKEYGKVYGKDWIHIGYRVAYLSVVLRGMSEDFHKVLGTDIHGRSLKSFEVTKNVQGAKDFGAVVEITPSATIESWIAYMTGIYKIPLVYCPTAVMAAEAYPYLDSGQISGMLNGVIGAAQYEVLLGMGDVATDAIAYSWALSFAFIFIIILIVLGNLSYIMTRSRRK